MYLGFNSMPINLRPNFRATTPVVPEPQNGSRTTPGFRGPPQLQAAWSRDGVDLCDAVLATTGSFPCPLPQPTQAHAGHPALIGISTSFSGKVAKCAPLNGCVAMRQTHRRLRPSGRNPLWQMRCSISNGLGWPNACLCRFGLNASRFWRNRFNRSFVDGACGSCWDSN
jgi:hypothetical protein